MVNIGHNWTPIQYTQRKYINFIHIKAETLSNLCSHDYYFNCITPCSIALQFPNKIIYNPYFLCLYPVNFLRLSNQYAVNQSV